MDKPPFLLSSQTNLCRAIAIIISCGIIAFFPTEVVTAAVYEPLENLPGFEGVSEFPQYIRSVYLLFMWIVGICSMLMIIIGGFWYMSSAGNNARIETAKTMIKDAIIGLILALTAWLILNTINPDLLKIKPPGTGQTYPSLSNELAVVPTVIISQ